MASRLSPTSVCSETKRMRSKFMFAPETMQANVLPFQPFSAESFFAAASASAPAGSQMARVASKMSLIAAHVSSVVTRTIPSRYLRHSSNVILPGVFTATPSAKSPTCCISTRFPARIERYMQSESTGSTP